MISARAVSGSLQAICPRTIISRCTLLDNSSRLLKCPQFFVRTLVSSQTHQPPLRHRNVSNSLTALRENIQQKLLDTKSAPAESEVLLALQACHSYAALQLEAVLNVSTDTTPAAVLLSLDDDPTQQVVNELPAKVTETSPASTEKTFPGDFEPLTDIAYKILSHPSVFLTLPILTSYVSLQSLIRDPSPIPAVFSLYANKPFTPPGSTKTLYPNPRQAKYAIPSGIASAALDSAIDVKDMSLCLDIIDTSYGAPAYQRARLVRTATPAAVAGCLTPAAVYAIADKLAGYQDEVDHSLAIKYGFAGMLAYVCFTGSIGMVALMTANDQMIRVTWIVGTPLRRRWLREEERMALDRVAQAWGFEEPNRRGFEEGEEWELLRDVVNRKGMYLDNPALMEGME